MTTWTEHLAELDPAALSAIFPDPRAPALDEARAVWTRERHAAEDRRGARNARQLIDRLPEAGESLHYVWSGQFRHATVVPVILDLAGCTCRQLSISTLGYDDRCVELLLSELDAGRIQRIDMLSCLYHAAHNAEQSARWTQELARRGSRHAASKTHAKVLSFQFTDGHAVVVESSSNLRSCSMLEMSVISANPALAEWHRKWIDDVLTKELSR